ncbi:type II methionyl aminopeptidase [Candidatus Woesearchaeota archaeon]|nr:type II methionyl aminopeptidase [Candidatus Woesearchaeota archaeon]
MNPEDLKKWEKAGNVAAQALEFGRSLIKSGAVIREVCDKVDQKILDLGARPAWPTQVGLNHVAAHETPDPEDNKLFSDEVVCLDVGAHVEGFVGDNACSVDLSGRHKELIAAAEAALNAAIKAVRVGVQTGELGRIIQDQIVAHGAVPVRNLSGHGISQWVIHDKPSVPNFASGEKTVVPDGQIIAIEPFASTGAGMVVEAERSNLFAVVNPRQVRSPFARDVLKFCLEEYNTLPFTTRWLTKKFGQGRTNLALRELLQAGVLHSYPPLVDASKGMVTVFEKTLLVGEKVKVLTTVD